MIKSLIQDFIDNGRVISCGDAVFFIGLGGNRTEYIYDDGIIRKARINLRLEDKEITCFWHTRKAATNFFKQWKKKHEE